jgi:hypothetical protein
MRSFGFFDVQKERTRLGRVSRNAHLKWQPRTRVPKASSLLSL